MSESRLKSLAKQIVNFSIGVEPGDRILIESWESDELAVAVASEVWQAGGIPFIARENTAVRRGLIMGLTEVGAEAIGKLALERIERMQGFISIRGMSNAFELGDVPPDKMALFNRATQPAKGHRMMRTKWCAMRYPTPGIAQKFHMSTEAFEDYYYKVMLLNYDKMNELSRPLIELVGRTDRVRIVAEDTDISFAVAHFKMDGPGFINGTGNGRLNLPDGEVGSLPVRESINGHIHYNVPTEYNGIAFDNVRLSVKDGRIYDAVCGDKRLNAALNEILDTDEGGRGFGEFSLGINPVICAPVGDILFDEKMWGSLHFTPGAPGSAVHWDMVLSQKAEDGGGELWFDDVLIRKDGIFLTEELRQLNPERLLPEIEYIGE
ncbi:MAG: aminopeptidase [Oscillospiraceae bacterium]|nr:aminopeptidase [Oscillospiraceae bacterium]